MSNNVCTCKDWEPGLDKINAYIATAHARTGQQYTGKPFKFCPWCGKPSRFLAEAKPKPKPKKPHKNACPAGGRHTWQWIIPATGIRFAFQKCAKCHCLDSTVPPSKAIHKQTLHVLAPVKPEDICP